MKKKMNTILCGIIGASIGFVLALYGDSQRKDYIVPYETVTGYEVDASTLEPVYPDKVRALIEAREDSAEIEEVETEELSVPIYNEEDLYYLSRAIMGEAGASYCSDEMRHMVGCVILNRVADERFPNTIKEVVLQENQYACTWIEEFYTRELSTEVLTEAQELLNSGSDIPADVLYQAEFTQGTVYKQIQNEYFCYAD